VLPKSYRVPKEIYHFANTITDRIQNRHKKEWSPVSDSGKIHEREPLNSLPLESGEWMILVRNTKFMRDVEKVLKDKGLLYNNTKWKNPRSIKIEDATLIVNWNKLRKGQKIDSKSANELLRCLYPKKAPKLLMEYVGMQDMPLPEQTKNQHWYEILGRQLTDKTVEYIRSCLQNNQKLNDKPRITLSTIHKVKGGECENVAVLPDISPLTYQFIDSDTEHRIQYVAATRTKNNLYLIKPSNDLFYRY
jgi:hypothetical protein